MALPPSFSAVKRRFLAQQTSEQALIGFSSQALRFSKQAIFAVHREKLQDAQDCLKSAETAFLKAEALFRRNPSLAEQGSYQAAVEEYGEACFFLSFVTTKKWGNPPARLTDPAVFFGALSDATGELVRYAVRRGSLGQTGEVFVVAEAVEQVVGLLLDLDATGALRQKIDQARRNLETLERMCYELHLRV